jgi:uncharacterized protein YegP (UPF0339 family)
MKPYKLEIWKTKRGGFRWRSLARSGKVIAAATEDFARYRSCRRNLVLGSGVDFDYFRVPGNWTQGMKHLVVRRH